PPLPPPSPSFPSPPSPALELVGEERPVAVGREGEDDGGRAEDRARDAVVPAPAPVAVLDAPEEVDEAGVPAVPRVAAGDDEALARHHVGEELLAAVVAEAAPDLVAGEEV